MTDKSEAFSRILIDEELTYSGWDLHDPHQLHFEYHTQNGRADYLLMDRNGGVLCVLEAKKEDVDPYDAKEQARGYAENLNAPFVILSNGMSLRGAPFATKRRRVEDCRDSDVRGGMTCEAGAPWRHNLLSSGKSILDKINPFKRGLLRGVNTEPCRSARNDIPVAFKGLRSVPERAHKTRFTNSPYAGKHVTRDHGLAFQMVRPQGRHHGVALRKSTYLVLRKVSY